MHSSEFTSSYAYLDNIRKGVGPGLGCIGSKCTGVPREVPETRQNQATASANYRDTCFVIASIVLIPLMSFLLAADGISLFQIGPSLRVIKDIHRCGSRDWGKAGDECIYIDSWSSCIAGFWEVSYQSLIHIVQTVCITIAGFCNTYFKG